LSAIDDLIAQVQEPRLREQLKREWAEAQKTKKFGLVFDRHLPEFVPIPKARPRRGDLVAKKPTNGSSFSLTDLWRVRRVSGGMVHCVRPEGTAGAGDPWDLPLDELVVVRQFGEPIFPALVPIDQVQNGPAEAPWHCLIEADNFHALQLLAYLYAGKVDCIYIDPPYNTGARDWKYNNDYVDANDAWRVNIRHTHPKINQRVSVSRKRRSRGETHKSLIGTLCVPAGPSLPRPLVWPR